MANEVRSFKCYLVSWNEAARLAKSVAKQIKRSEYKPDLIIAVARGGLVPARIICDFLHHKDVVSIKVEHWGIAATLGTADIKYFLPPQVDAKDKKILIIDDVADTGDTFLETLKYIKSLDPVEVRTAVLHYKTSSSFEPDYWGEKLTRWNWIIYPWAIFEDINGFIEKVLKGKSLSSDEIKYELKRVYDINISKKWVSDILTDMHENQKIRRIKTDGRIAWELRT